MKKVFIIHGWGGSPDEEIHKWLKSELQSHGFQVKVPKMPLPEEPQIKKWIPFLQKLAPNPDENTFFIGHSIGCQTILRYLETLPEKTKIGGVVLLAPWTTLLETSYENPDEEREIAKQWIETPINWEKVKSLSGNFVSIFSDDDFCVPLSESKIFEEKLNSKIIVEHSKGHFTMENDISKVPSVLDSILEMSK